MFPLFTFLRRCRDYLMSILLQSIRRKMKYTRLEMIFLMIFFIFILNIFLFNQNFHCSSILSSNQVKTLTIISNNYPISTIERSRKALENLKILLNSTRSSNDRPWVWSSSLEYLSLPYQPTSLLNQNIPKSIHNNISIVPQSVKDEINRVCQRLNNANKIGGEIWCKLFENCYTDTLATTTTLLDDNSTYIITGDIDLMWIRDSR